MASFHDFPALFYNLVAQTLILPGLYKGRLPGPDDDLTGIEISNYRVGDRTYDIKDGRVIDITPVAAAPLQQAVQPQPLHIQQTIFPQVLEIQQTISPHLLHIQPGLLPIATTSPAGTYLYALGPFPSAPVPGTHGFWYTQWNPYCGWVNIWIGL